MHNIVLFDGECNFCDSTVQFIIKRDNKDVFKFASLQSSIGQELLEKHNVPNDLDSIVLIKGDKVFFKSTAALLILKELRMLWKLCYIFVVFPTFFRDFFYDKFARNRYKLFGKKEMCHIPTAEERSKFL